MAFLCNRTPQVRTVTSKAILIPPRASVSIICPASNFIPRQQSIHGLANACFVRKKRRVQRAGGRRGGDKRHGGQT